MWHMSRQVTAAAVDRQEADMERARQWGLLSAVGVAGVCVWWLSVGRGAPGEELMGLVRWCVAVIGAAGGVVLVVEAVARSRRVRLALSDPPLAFRLGSTVTAVPVSNAGEAIDLPLSALLERDGKSFVWVVDQTASTVSLHGIDVTAKGGASFTAGGIEAGTRVVTAGVHSLQEGQKVRIDEGA